ncbi:MAG: FAD binding domain-containing protein [Myxococcales bacterium]|nr:FAD binding domain-containing protein [Myxococcales bacterium]
MLRMPEFEVHRPTTAAEAVRLRTELPDAMFVAGGTDLLPNLKHHLHTPKHLVSLSRVAGLSGIERADDGTLRIGATTSLHAVATDEGLRAEVPGLAKAASLVAGPQHRRMGTIGGNVLLDTRCLFYNQSLPWRQALGACLKSEGTWCHVIGSDKSCVAAQSSDTVPMLVALDASIEVTLPGGATQTVALGGLWTKDGRFERNRTLPAEALLTAVVIPPRAAGHRSTYRKVRSRQAIDFPQVGVAVVAGFEGDRLGSLTVVVGAMLPHPKRLDHDAVAGRELDDALIEHVAERAYKQVRPQPQVHGDPGWRRELARVETRRALRELLPG